MTISDELMKLVAALKRAGATPYLVGGCVRDRLMWRTPADLDMEVYGLTPTDLEAVLKEHVTFVEAVGSSFSVFKVMLRDRTMMDISLPRTESKAGSGHRGFMISANPFLDPAVAAARRDFTINSLIMDPITKEITDFFGGQSDIAKATLRATSPAFSEDPLRVLRGMQFASRFDMRMDHHTAELCANMYEEYDTLAKERVWQEWVKWSSGARPSRGLDLLKQTGWVNHYPALSLMMGVAQEFEWHPDGDVWMHTRQVVDAAAGIAARQSMHPENRTILVLAALLHDCGKPHVSGKNERGQIVSPGHAEKGAEVAAQFLDDIGAPGHVNDRVCMLVAEHMWHVTFMEQEPSRRSVRRLANRLEKVGTNVEELALLVEADRRGRTPIKYEVASGMEYALALAKDLDVLKAGPRPLLMGRHLLPMMPAGKAMGERLARAFEAQLDGEFDTIDGGLDWLRGKGLIR